MERRILCGFILSSVLAAQRVRGASAVPDVSCYIVNLEYVNCTWNLVRNPEVNYTFFGRFGTLKPTTVCPSYMWYKDVAVGCRFPCERSDHFNEFYSTLQGNGSMHNQTLRLKDRVKLNPPTNLTVEWKDDNLLLHWVTGSSVHCYEYEIQYSRNDQWKDSTKLNGGNEFMLALPSNTSRYEFKVRVRIGEACGLSTLWSEWSPIVAWGNSTAVNEIKRPSSSYVIQTVCGVMAAALLILLSFLLVRSERLRVILVPVVPNPVKNLVELIDTYNGNVEKWLCIYKGMEEGFKPNFTERVCSVQEYQGNEDSSEGLTIYSEDTDCPSLCSNSSSSTMPSMAESELHASV
ncbi:cytokine receptor common subunit gamma-like [Denticeps clupeoides]|uniref:Fibronectin type-III domain-containing protein n=1 Tax=Denticeps clupeoides TaxID=299321 RepID=A0AAY4EIR0_9TELE|nr:cytokine receptor common subunit gamma-like [Denticeps clupeoides]XP_028839552.1 cytokine receptor common subunit gamma-like [Denticeps clupeoides]